MKTPRIRFATVLLTGIMLFGLIFQFACQSSPAEAPADSPTSGRPTATRLVATDTPEPTMTPVPQPTATPRPPTSTDSPTPHPTGTPEPTPTPATWLQLNGMLSSQSEMPALVLDGRIYIAGGATLDATLVTQRVFQVYDPETDRWTGMADLPFPTDHYGVAAYHGDIYVFSRKLVNNEPAVTAVLRYEFDTDSWTELGLMPEVRHAGAAVTLGDYIYYVGGMTSRGTHALLRYHPPTNTWTALAELRRPREHNQAVVLNGEIYALGGRWEGGMTSVEIYNPEDDTWRSGQGLRHPRSGFGAAVLDGKIIVAGGELFSPELLINSIEAYDPETRRWEVAPFTLPVRMHGLALASLDGRLFVVGGSSELGGIRNSGTLYELVENWP